MSTHARARGRNVVRALIVASVAGLAALGVTLLQAAAATGADGATAPPPIADSNYIRLEVHVRHAVLTGWHDHVKGRLVSTQRHGSVAIQVRPSGRGWGFVARARTDSHGRFESSWRPRSLGHYDVRAAVTGTNARKKAPGGVTVYKAARASWYGPGLYGNRTACGGRLSPRTLGVANKTLPCGTRVALYYHGHTVTAPVIDRGPYVAGREYDLTKVTKDRLHFGSTGTVWSAPHRH